MDKHYAGDERRKFRRQGASFTVFYRVNSPSAVRIKIGEREIIALASDISEGGMAIATDCEIPAISIITIKFVMLNDLAFDSGNRSRSITVEGEVRHNKVDREGREYKIGVNFIGLSEEDRRFIKNFVTENK
jgi:c-di-GMP-binding flagellar brake protein YcgR